MHHGAPRLPKRSEWLAAILVSSTSQAMGSSPRFSRNSKAPAGASLHSLNPKRTRSRWFAAGARGGGIFQLAERSPPRHGSRNGGAPFRQHVGTPYAESQPC